MSGPKRRQINILNGIPAVAGLWAVLILGLGCGDSTGSGDAPSDAAEQAATGGEPAQGPANWGPGAAKLRHQLGIPDSARRVLFLSQTAHMDWDWLNWFPTNVDDTYPPDQANYFHGDVQPADTILRRAYNSLTSFPDYYYSTCEVGFLRAFAESKTHPEYAQYFEAMKNTGRYRIVGGGITSPDNLLPAGETFFRNFLVADTWLTEKGLPWTGQVWLPDDFGHDAQLPVMLEALGAAGVGFSRVPGGTQQQDLKLAPPGTPTTNDALMEPVTRGGGIDFLWQAADGSSCFSHYMPDHYSQGADIDDANYQQQIQGFVDTNGPVSPSPYIYVPVSNDFMSPLGGTDPPAPPAKALLEYAAQWNAAPPAGYSDVYVVVGPFDIYAELVAAWNQLDPSALRTRTFQRWDQISDQNTAFLPTPYWMGFYASRPELKRLHHEATRTLLKTEAFDAMASLLSGSSALGSSDLFDAWDHLVPSTHHDFITGTATDYVYDGSYQGKRGEQLVMLEESVVTAKALEARAGAAVAEKIGVTSTSTAVFNGLGFARSGLVEIADSNWGVPRPSGICRQATAEGSCLDWATVDSLGYATHPQSSPPALPGTVSLSRSGGKIVLQNDRLRATVDEGTFALVSVLDVASPSTNLLSAPANTLAIYQDAGGIYRYGFEMDKTFALQSYTTSVTNLQVLESGPIRVRVGADVALRLSGTSQDLTYGMEYSLVVGEPMVRMRLTGFAPGPTTRPSLSLGSSVMVSFPLTASIDGVQHGTPYHWTTKTPWSYTNGSDFDGVFEATHDFVIPLSGTRPLGAVFHGSVPSWSAVGETLYGCVLRNTPSNGSFGANGSDPASHTVDYAFRVPSGLGDAATGGPLREARAYATPLSGVWLGPSAGSLPTSYSLASVSGSGAPGSAWITVAKAGTADPSAWILRLYQASNTSQDMTLTLAPQLGGSTLTRVTALERAVSGAVPSTSPTLTLDRAVTSVQLQKSTN